MMEGISAYTIVQAERMMGEEALSVFLRSFRARRMPKWKAS